MKARGVEEGVPGVVGMWSGKQALDGIRSCRDLFDPHFLWTDRLKRLPAAD
jgi:hypothetical protein